MWFMKMECQTLCEFEEIMLKLNEFCHNHNSSGVKMLVKFFRRGTWMIIHDLSLFIPNLPYKMSFRG